MSANHTANLGMHSFIGTDYVRRAEFNENFDIIDKELGQQNYIKEKSGKDTKKIYTVEKWKRKADNSLFRKFELSGGETPCYTTLTMTEYTLDGVTVVTTKTWTLVYDDDKDLISVTPN